MKKAVTLGLAALVLGLPLTYVVAGSRNPEPLPPVTPADAMPAYELFTRLRMLELEPQGEPVRRGPYYVLHAADTRGHILRVVADAELGDILSIAPARAPLWRPHGAPRIIHVPDALDSPEARLDGEDWPDDVPADIEEETRAPASARPQRHVRSPQRKAAIAPPRREVARKPAAAVPAEPSQPAAQPEPAPLERRNVLTAPPAEAAARDPLTPVYPTPRFGPPDSANTNPAPPQPAGEAPQSPAAPAPVQ